MLLGDAPARDIDASEGWVDQWPIRQPDLSEWPRPSASGDRACPVRGASFSINGLSMSGAAFIDWFTYAEVTFFADNALAGALTVG